MGGLPNLWALRLKKGTYLYLVVGLRIFQKDSHLNRGFLMNWQLWENFARLLKEMSLSFQTSLPQSHNFWSALLSCKPKVTMFRIIQLIPKTQRKKQSKQL